MVSFLKNLFKKKTPEDEQVKKKTTDDSANTILKESRSRSTSNASSAMEASNGILLLPNVTADTFQAPKYVPVLEWQRSQVFEIIHLLDGFLHLIRLKNPKVPSTESSLESILTDLENITDFHECLHSLASTAMNIYQQESVLIHDLKLEGHLNTLLLQIMELVHQLPHPNRVFDSLKCGSLESIISISNK